MLLSMFPPDAFVNLNEVFNKNHFRDQDFTGFPVDPEIPRELRRNDPARFIDEYLLDSAGFGGRTPIWKVQYQNLDQEGDSWKTWLPDAIAARPDICVIHLVREDLVARFVSMRTARTSRQFVLREQETPVVPEPIEVDPKKCLINLNRVMEQTQWVDQRFARSRFVRVTYEQLVDDPSSIEARMAERFEMDIDLLPPTTLKQGRPLAEAVRNIEELRAGLAGTPWAQYVSDEQPAGHGRA